MKLIIHNHTKTIVELRIFRLLLQPARKILIAEKKIKKSQNFLIELNFVGTAAMVALNRKHHDKNRSTDVISLSYFDKKMKDPFLGEIFICIPYAKIQAQRIGQSLKEELRFLFTHGLLHLFRYDHKKPRDDVYMKKLTYKILGRVAK